jgi:hypothetical protein
MAAHPVQVHLLLLKAQAARVVVLCWAAALEAIPCLHRVALQLLELRVALMVAAVVAV